MQSLHERPAVRPEREQPMTPLSSRDLQAFMAIAEELSFRRAAERLFIDQSALSRRVQNLEETLGFQLIFRTTREVMLTEAGRIFYEEITPAMNRLARAGDVARVAAEGRTGRLRIAYMSFAATEVMPQAVKAYAASYPDIALELSYLRTQQQKLALSRGEIDVGFMLGPFHNPQFEQVAVARERLLALVPADHELAARPHVTLADLAACRMVLGAHDQWDFFRRLLDEIFHSAGLALKADYEPSNTMGILGLVGSGLGVSIYAEGLMRFQPQRVAFKPIADCTTEIETLMCWNRGNQAPALRNFVTTVTSMRKPATRARTSSAS
jgi:DNA-binding transcriptional LysR family regulator